MDFKHQKSQKINQIISQIQLRTIQINQLILIASPIITKPKKIIILKQLLQKMKEYNNKIFEMQITIVLQMQIIIVIIKNKIYKIYLLLHKKFNLINLKQNKQIEQIIFFSNNLINNMIDSLMKKMIINLTINKNNQKINH